MRGTVCGLNDFPNALMKSADLCPRTQLLTFLCYSPTPEESFTRLISKETRGFFFLIFISHVAFSQWIVLTCCV